MVNMTAYHAITLFSPCQANKLFFKIRNIRNGSLYPILNRLGKGIIRFSLLHSAEIVYLIQP